MSDNDSVKHLGHLLKQHPGRLLKLIRYSCQTLITPILTDTQFCLSARGFGTSQLTYPLSVAR